MAQRSLKVLKRKLSKNSSNKSKRSYKKKQSKRSHRKQKGGDGYIMQVEAPTVGGQTARMGYSDCCPPSYADGKVAYTDTGNRMCGGGKKRKSRKSKGKRKQKKSRSQRKK